MISYRSNKRYLIFHLALFVMVSIATLFFTMRLTPEELEKYDQIMTETRVQPQGYKTQQERSNIYRQLLLVHKESRLQTRLTAKQGTFFVHKEDNNPGLTELLEDITCLMQEELFYVLPDGREVDSTFHFKKKHEPLSENEIVMLKPMQTLRYIQAHEANYDYRSNFLTTQAMNFSRYTAPGHQLPTNIEILTPTVVGKAISAEITFKDTGPEFRAQKLQVNLPNTRLK